MGAAFLQALRACLGDANVLVDGVVANAGVGVGGRSTDIAESGIRQVMDTNLLGSMLEAREAARRMIAEA